jgi:hypothetical protein
VTAKSYQHFRSQVFEACRLLCEHTEAQLGSSNDRIRVGMLEGAFRALKREQSSIRRVAKPIPQSPQQSQLPVQDAVTPVKVPEAWRTTVCSRDLARSVTV